MDFKAFKKMIVCKVQMFLGNEYEVTEQSITKNNGVRLTGIMAKRKGVNTFPTVYIDDYYTEDLTRDDVEYLAMKLSKSLTRAELPQSVDLEDFTNYECVRDRLSVKLINAEKNKELLFEVPHERFHNLAVIYYYQVDESLFDGRASILIKNSHLTMWGIEEETLRKDALASSQLVNPSKLYPMRELLKEMYGEDILEEDFPMYVLTNRTKYNGAASILYPNVLKKFADEMEKNFYVLPSSVHELILVPDDEDINERELLSTVTDINRTQVGEEELLSDSVYFYDREKDLVSWIC